MRRWSNGRAVVSKTIRWGFDSFPSCKLNFCSIIFKFYLNQYNWHTNLKLRSLTYWNTKHTTQLGSLCKRAAKHNAPMAELVDAVDSKSTLRVRVRVPLGVHIMLVSSSGLGTLFFRQCDVGSNPTTSTICPCRQAGLSHLSLTQKSRVRIPAGVHGFTNQIYQWGKISTLSFWWNTLVR